jgi:hypothetical protein
VVSDESAVSVFRVEKVKIYPEERGGSFFQNMDTCLQNYMVQNSRRTQL